MTDFSFTGASARGYDERVEEIIPGYALMQRMTAVYLGTQLSEAATILMVGVGTGAEIVACAEGHSGWRFTAVDPSADMLALAKAKTEAQGVSDRVIWHPVSVKNLPEQEPFDAATLLLVLHFLPDDGGKAALLEHIIERLKPGAPLVLSSFVGDPANTRTKKLYDLAQAYAVAGGVKPEEAADRLNVSRKDVHLVPEERIKNLLRDAGFIDVQRILQGLAMTTWIARAPR